MDDSLLKTNFVGRDGFRWWIGQIPPASVQEKQINGSGWGNRYKVRIMGYHPYSVDELPNEDLPWAQCLIPTTSGSGGANVASDVKLQQGDVVFGFFLDGDNAQLPVIIGCFGRTSQVPSEDFKSPFVPFTGYNDKIPKPEKDTLPSGESNESNASSLKSPRHVSPAQAKKVGNNEVSYFSGIGDTLQLGSGSSSTVVDKISCEVLNLLKAIQDGIGIYLNLGNEIKRIVRKIQSIVYGLVGGIVNDLYYQLVPILNEGLNLLYDQIYALTMAATGGNIAASRAAAVAAQQALAAPIKLVQDQIPQIINGIIGNIGDSIANILINLIDNVERFSSCVGIQFAASVINDIINKITNQLTPAIEGISSILKFFTNFSVDDVIRNSVNAISGITDSLNVGQIAPNYEAQVKQWIVGSGANNVSPTPFEEILKNANVSQAISIVDGVLSAYSIFNESTKNPNSDCYSGPPLNCSAPKVTIFGGTGSGATAIPLFGNIVDDSIERTASIIGIKITNPGSGYEYPPFINITDECGRGYGAVAATTINEKGEVTGAFIISQGENYPVGDEVPPYVIDKVIIERGGENYSPNDTVIDDYGNEYKIQVSSNGTIVDILPLNITSIVTDIPVLTVKTKTGYGAKLKTILDVNIEQKDIIQSIDCITK